MGKCILISGSNLWIFPIQMSGCGGKELIQTVPVVKVFVVKNVLFRHKKCSFDRVIKSVLFISGFCGTGYYVRLLKFDYQSTSQIWTSLLWRVLLVLKTSWRYILIFAHFKNGQKLLVNNQSFHYFYQCLCLRPKYTTKICILKLYFDLFNRTTLTASRTHLIRLASNTSSFKSRTKEPIWILFWIKRHKKNFRLEFNTRGR